MKSYLLPHRIFATVIIMASCLVSSTFADIAVVIDDMSGIGNGSLAEARQRAKGYAKGTGNLRYPSMKQGDAKLFIGSFTPPELPDDKKAKYVYGLAIFSDDGCKVMLDGKTLHDRFNKPQALPDHKNSFYVLPCLLTPGKRVEIKVSYFNTHYITNGAQPDIDGASLFVFLTEAPVDMDVDSDNNNGFGNPDRTQGEDIIEENSAKNILPNIKDSDNDGLPDYADGFGLEGHENSETVASSLKFVPVKVELKGSSFDPSKTRVKFTYAKESEPKIGKGLRAGVEGEAPVMVAQGGMRLWNAAADQRKNANPIQDGGIVKGDYIPSGKEVNWTEIVRGNNSKEATLYVEYVDTQPPTTTGRVNLIVEVYQEGKVIIGGENVTVPSGLRIEQKDEVKVDLQSVDIVVKDNIFSTGVDDVSRTAVESDSGYQKDYWIMAPFQGPALPNAAAYENMSRMRIISDGNNAGDLSSVNATAHPDNIALDGVFHDINWRGIGTGINSEETIKLKMAVGNEEIDLPVKVKAMKYRKVKLRVCLVAKDLGGGTTVEPDPNLVPTKAELENYLNPLFAYQLNTWFDVTIHPDIKAVNFGADFELANPHSSDQGLAYAAFTGNDQHHINVFIIGKNGTLGLLGGVAGYASVLNNTCWILGKSVPGYESKQDVLETLGHEIGHIFFEAGHPDERDPLQRGVAPLVGTDHSKRLMASGSIFNPNSQLIVKAEWDKAEEWLKEREKILSMEP
jgi:hypothetical protein